MPLSTLPSLAVPSSDALFWPAILDFTIPFFEATMHFDESEALVAYTIHRGG